MHITGRLFAVGVALLPAFAQAQPAPEPPLDPPDRVEQTLPREQAGERLVLATLRAAAGFRPKEGEFYCYRYVKLGVRSALGATLTGVHAYQAANQLAQSPCFREIGIARRQLKPEDVPRGAVVVWQPTSSYPSGHIFVSMGRGQEVSDRIRPMSTHYGSTARVFVPQDQCQGP